MGQAHTTGPWSVEGPDEFGDYNIHCQHERAVVAAVINNVRPPEEVAANARLIAAAPDLVKAMDECQRFLNDLTDPDKKASGPNIIASFGNAIALSSKVRAALSAARATGGTE